MERIDHRLIISLFVQVLLQAKPHNGATRYQLAKKNLDIGNLSGPEVPENQIQFLSTKFEPSYRVHLIFSL